MDREEREREPGYSHVGIVWGRPRVNADAVAIGVGIFGKYLFFAKTRRNPGKTQRFFLFFFFLFCNISCKFFFIVGISASYTDKRLLVKC